MSEQPILFDRLSGASRNGIAIATLNSPKSLNSLTLDMVDLLSEQLTQWADDPEIACILIHGKGDRAFCAGGDVVRLRQSALDGDDYAATFFAREYRLDHQIHTYPKPIIVWGHGAVMGGGLGIMAGASHRVVTETTKMAMPEITIGLFPDVGATYLLNRTPGRCGLFMALTGVPINASDALFAGFADRFIRHDHFDQVLQELQRTPWTQESIDNSILISSILRKFEESSSDNRPVSALRQHFDWIQQATDTDTLEDVVTRITGYQGDDTWLEKAAATLAAGCPTSIRIVGEQLRRGRHLSLSEAFQMELVIACNCLRYPNFAEGVRALLVDKDRKPVFQPPTLAEVSTEVVENHFMPPWQGEHPLADLGQAR